MDADKTQFYQAKLKEKDIYKKITNITHFSNKYTNSLTKR